MLLSGAAGPVVGLEWRGWEACGVGEVGVGGAVPSEADVFGGFDVFGGDDDGVAVDGGCGGDEFSVGAGDGKLGERFAVA